MKLKWLSKIGYSTMLLGFLIVVIGAVLVASASIFMFELESEQLQAPLLLSFIVFGLLAGTLMAARLRRVAFVECVGVVALVCSALFARFEYADRFFMYGATPAYMGAIIFAGALALLIALTLGGTLGYLLLGDGRLTLSFSYEAWMGRRFLMAKRRGHVVSWITFISVFAVMVGVSSMIVVTSVMNGFSTDLRSKILGANAYLILFKYGNDFTEYANVMIRTKAIKGVTGASPFTLNEGMLSSEFNLTGALIKGIDTKTVQQVTSLKKNVTEGHLEDIDVLKSVNRAPERVSEIDKLARAIERQDKKAAQVGTAAGERPAELTGIVIGQEMAQALRVEVGDVVNMISPLGELGPTGPVPRAKPFRVAAIFISGMYEYDSKFAYISLNDAQDLFGLGRSIAGIEYKTANLDHTQVIAHQMMKMLGGYPYYTKDWMQMNRPLFSALKLEKIAMFIILTSAIFMASLLILVALIMVVMEKGKEIAILKSMGATDVSIMKIFVTYGVIIGSLGAFLGLFFGLLLCWIVSSVGIGLDASVYYITKLPVRVEPIEVALVLVCALVVSFLATIPPSLYAARLQPVEGLRYE